MQGKKVSTDLLFEDGGREGVQDRVQGRVDRENEDGQPSVEVFRDGTPYYNNNKIY